MARNDHKKMVSLIFLARVSVPCPWVSAGTSMEPHMDTGLCENSVLLS